MEFEIFLVAATAAWTGDDWCPTPPRPPWPWPWFLRKLIAVLGGVGLVFVVIPLAGGGDVDILPVVLAGMIGGVTLASLVGNLAGYARPGANVDRAGP